MVVPFLIYLATQHSGYGVWIWVIVVAAVALLISYLAGERFENPRYQFGHAEAIAISSSSGIVLLYLSKAIGGVDEYLALASLAMVYLMTYWFADSIRIIRRGHA